MKSSWSATRRARVNPRDMLVGTVLGMHTSAARPLVRICVVAAACAAGATAAASEPGVASPSSDVSRFVGTHCLACHGEQAEGGVRLQGRGDEAGILADPLLWRKVLRVVRDREMPPEDEPQPNAEERARFARAVQTVLDRFQPSDPGRVRVRRLNRVEYDNTIRDLVGIEGTFSKDFPADDVGHGFDNLGDVQSLSSSLLERYLAAAQAVMTRAIVVDAPAKPPVRRVAAQQLGPTGPFVKPQEFRALSPKDGPLFTPFFLDQNYAPIPLDPEQEYRLRVRMYARATASPPVRIALVAYGAALKAGSGFPDGGLPAGSQLVGGGLAKLGPVAVLKTFDVTATTPDAAETFEVPLGGIAGVQGAAVAIVQVSADAEPGEAAVAHLELEGPLDYRPPSQRRLLACTAGKPQVEQTREVLSRFASRAYRRPVEPAEVDRLVQFVQARQLDGDRWEAGMQLAMQAVLTSPKFLYRLELDDRPEAGDARPLDEYQLASRLSYFLWSTMPDDELFALAAQGRLTAHLPQQVQRMLRSPKATALVDNFVMQWLQLRRLENLVPDARLFPTFDEKLRRAMVQETRLFFETILREDRSVLDIIDADFTFLNGRLAKHYRIVDTHGTYEGRQPAKPGGAPLQGEDFRRVVLQPGERGGIVAQASILTVTSSPTRTSPVKRGMWILEQLLASPPPPPPANVPPLTEDEKAVASGSVRQRLEQHRSNPVCATCHARMDPLGFALENFDGIGAYRTKDGGFPVDASGSLPSGESFTGVDELRALLMKKKDDFCRCLVEKMSIYALGRGLTANDQAVIDTMARDLAAQDHRFSALVTLIITSDPFRMRGGDPRQ